MTRSTTPTTKAPTRLGWTRSGRASTGWLDGTKAPILATAAVAPSTGTPMPSTGTPMPSTGTPATAAGGAALAAATAAGPGVVGTAWDGLTDQAVPCGSSRPCVEPADPWVAVSATHVVQMTNESTRITGRSGGDPRQLTNREFFNVPAWSPTAFAADPRVLFDPAHGRWVATLFAGTCSGGALFLAVSETADPTGAWLRYYRPFAGVWPDFPTLGYSAALVAIGANEFGVSCGAGGSYVMGAYVGARLHVVDWADLTDGGDASTMQSTLPDPAAFSYAPAAGLSGGDALHAVVALDDGSADRADLAYVGVSGTVAGGTIAFGVPLSLAALPLDKLQDPPVPVDAGGLIGVQRNALDLRPTDAVWRDGRLAIASTSTCLRGTVYRPCARVTELLTRADLALPALRQDLRLLPASGYTDTFMPGVGYSDDGTLWTVFSQAGAGRYVSSWTRRQLATDPPGAWSPGAALVAAGRGPYGGTAGAGLNERWGDYVGVARDPAEPASVWQANQVADTGGGWTTRVARLGDDPTPPTLGAPRPFFVAGTRAGVSGVALKIAWSQADAGSGVASRPPPAQRQWGLLRERRARLVDGPRRHQHARLRNPLHLPPGGDRQRRQCDGLGGGAILHAEPLHRGVVAGAVQRQLDALAEQLLPGGQGPLDRRCRPPGDDDPVRPGGRLGLHRGQEPRQCPRLRGRRPPGDLHHLPVHDDLPPDHHRAHVRRGRHPHLPGRGGGHVRGARGSTWTPSSSCADGGRGRPEGADALVRPVGRARPGDAAPGVGRCGTGRGGTGSLPSRRGPRPTCDS